MKRSVCGLAVSLVQLLPAAVLADPPDRDVRVVNTPLPVVGDVNVMNNLTVQQGGPWAVDLNGPVAVSSVPPVSISSLPAVTGSVAVTSVPQVSIGSLPEVQVRIVGGGTGTPGSGPDPVYLFAKANGQDIHGDSTQTSLGRQDAIECLSFNLSVITARETGSGQATGRRQWQPISCVKRIDKASPYLFMALIENKNIDAMFKFYRPNPSGDGTTQQFYTVEIHDGRIATLSQLRPDLSAGSTLPPMEELTLVFQEITGTYQQGGITWSDDWNTTP